MLQKIKSIFMGYKTPKCTAVDISSKSVKVVDLFNKSYKVKNFSIVNLDKRMIDDSKNILEAEFLSQYVIDAVQKAKVRKDAKISTFLPHKSIISKKIECPIFSNKFLLNDYLENYLSENLESNKSDQQSYDFDYQVLNKEATTQTLNVVVANKETFEDYQAVMQLANLNLEVMDTEVFAVTFLTERLMSERKNIFQSQNILVDLGVNSVKLYVFIDGKMESFVENKIHHHAIFSDFTMDNMLSGVINLSSSELVKDLYELIKSNENLNGKIICEFLLSEISKNLISAKSNLLIEKNISLNNPEMFLMGGLSLMPNLVDEITQSGICSNVRFCDELFGHQKINLKIDEIVRLYPTIALATWGNE